jgi:hypothetical protein
MGATEEQMDMVADSGMGAVPYILILYAISLLAFLFILMLIHVYDRATTPRDTKEAVPNGHARANGRIAEDRQVRDAEEFELDGLISEDEDEDAKLFKDEPNSSGLASPSTIGRNNEPLAR